MNSLSENVLRIKCGDSFVLGCEASDSNGAPLELTAYNIRAEVRRASTASPAKPAELVADLRVDITNASLGQYELAAPGDSTTSSWPIGALLLDIVYETTGSGNTRVVASTETVTLHCMPRVTQP